jgi:hypothetical protein
MTSKVRVLLPPPRFALTGYAWPSQAETVGAKRVRRSLSEAKAWTDRRRSLWAKAGARFASYGSASHPAIINGKDSRKADTALAFN